MTSPAVSITSLSHAWPGADLTLKIERFEVAAGESVFLVGPSGSGKSTLLGLIAGVTPVQSGRIEVLGEPMLAEKSQKRDAIRASRLGVIFQMFNLVPFLSAMENVLLPLQFSPERRQRLEAVGRDGPAEARRLLRELRLDDTSLTKTATDLSVGQQQRVAAARALIGGPGLVIADEPTSALDRSARDSFIALLMQECSASGAALLFVSHDEALAAHFDRKVDLGEINRAGVTA